jgi:hypothetical protein
VGKRKTQERYETLETKNLIRQRYYEKKNTNQKGLQPQQKKIDIMLIQVWREKIKIKRLMKKGIKTRSKNWRKIIQDQKHNNKKSNDK